MMPRQPVLLWEVSPVEEEDNGEIRVAVIGRPNIGKSTLINRLVGEDRHVVHDMPGTTMDSVDSVFTDDDGQVWRFVDTAGVRRRARIGDKLESFATAPALAHGLGGPVKIFLAFWHGVHQDSGQQGIAQCLIPSW